MRKRLKIESLIDPKDVDSSALQIEKLLNKAIEKVIDNLMDDLDRGGVFNNKAEAKRIADMLLGQVAMYDYPDL